MRHLLVLPFAAIALAACAAPPGPGLHGSRAFALEPGASVELASGTTLRFDAAEDSRCPPGVACVWAGKLTCRFSLLRGGATLEAFALAPGDTGHATVLLDGARLALDESTLPPPATPGAIANHRVTVKLLPRPSP